MKTTKEFTPKQQALIDALANLTQGLEELNQFLAQDEAEIAALEGKK